MSSCCQRHATSVSHSQRTITLVGNPNCGKTTLFNALTGACQHVGNWPGVTVEQKSGCFIVGDTNIKVVDLPGVYALNVGDHAAVDERIASDFILTNPCDVIINIVDASNLDRHLYLTLQLLEMGLPVILALNMMDIVKARGLSIDLEALEKELGCPVVALSASKQDGVEGLRQAIISFVKKDKIFQLSYPTYIEEVVANLSATTQSRWLVIRLLEDDTYARNLVNEQLLAEVKTQQKRIAEQLGEDADILIADTRYQFIQCLLQAHTKQVTPAKKTNWTNRIDNIVLNRFLGIPIFLGIMYLLFVFAINLGGIFQDCFDAASQYLFVDCFSALLTYMQAPTWLIALLANGVGKGINTIITFVPVIAAMFLFLAFLEDTGYMARAAFVVDRVMRALGLPGKAFVPMIVGFGCNVPAVLGARTLENKRDRILTILMSPFMSCTARLAIYAVFTAAFFPQGGHNIVFALYLIGIAMAIFTGFFLRHSLLQGDPAPLVMELPLYHLPNSKILLRHTWQRLSGFVLRAGKLIVPICILIGALNALNIDGTLNTGEGDAHSILSIVGRSLTPIFAPMGIHSDNWPATVGLVTGVLAKEVVVGSLNTLYAQIGHIQAGAQSVYGLMFERFDGKVGAFAYLLFVLLYFPCVSTTAAMLRELNRGWALFSLLWMTGIAYGAAVIFYQAATLPAHPLTSLAWISSLLTIFLGTLITMRWQGGRYELARH